MPRFAAGTSNKKPISKAKFPANTSLERAARYKTNMAVALTSFPAFEVHLDGNVGPRSKKWLAMFENFTIGMGITEEKQKRALLLYYSDPKVDDIFHTLEETGEDYKTAVDTLTAHFNPQVDTTYKVYNFRKAQQKETESMDSFHTSIG